MLTVVLAVMGTVTSVSLGIHDCDRDPFRNSEFISADSKDWVDVLNIKHSFAVVIAKSALQSLLEIPCGIFCNLRWLST